MPYRDIYGHERQTEILQHAMQSGRLAHAYLFHGMEGIGKRTVAERFARHLLCAAPGKEGPCGACPACRKIDHGNHPDFMTIEADGAFIKIQAIRDMAASMAYRPLEGGWRVFLMNDADRMNPPAANALLKTLEEPSAANLLILVTARPHQLPATILSRCQQLRFTPLPREQVAGYLQDRLKLDAKTATALAASSGGSIRRAAELSEAGHLQMRNDLLDFLAAIGNPTPLDAFFLAQYMGREKGGIPNKIDILKTCFRDALAYGALGKPEILVNADRVDVAAVLSGRRTPRELAENIRILDRLARALEQNANKTLTLEAALFKVAL